MSRTPVPITIPSTSVGPRGRLRSTIPALGLRWFGDPSLRSRPGRLTRPTDSDQERKPPSRRGRCRTIGPRSPPVDPALRGARVQPRSSPRPLLLRGRPGALDAPNHLAGEGYMTTDQINDLIAKYGRPAFELAMRQVYIDAGIGATVAIIAGGIALALGFAGLRQWRIYKAFTGPSYRSEADVAAYLFWAGAIIA